MSLSSLTLDPSSSSTSCSARVIVVSYYAELCLVLVEIMLIAQIHLPDTFGEVVNCRLSAHVICASDTMW